MQPITRRLLIFLATLCAIHCASISVVFAKPLSISAVTATKISSGRAIITWTTSVPATSQVEYGASTGYGNATPVDNTLVTSHAVLIMGLAPNTTYHYRVKSQPTAGAGFVVSGDYAFKTLPPPPIRYRIQFWHFPNPASGGWPHDMNNLGQVVGWYHAPDETIQGYLYDPELDPNTAIDLDAVYRAPDPNLDGWKIHSATGINDLGVIVGKIDDPAGTIRTFLLDPLGIVLAPGIKLLPVEFFPESAVLRYLQINNNLDIVTEYENPDGSQGVYFFNYDAVLQDVTPGTLRYLPKPTNVLGSFSSPRLNNPTAAHAAQVCGKFADGTSFRWTPVPDGKLETFSPTVRGINDVGELCGDLLKSGKLYPMRLPGSTPQILSGAPSHYGTAINNNRDVLLDDSSGSISLLLYRDDLGYLDLDKLVTGSPDDLGFWFGAGRELFCMNDRDPATDFCQIVGRVGFPNTPAVPYILLPEIPVP